MILKPQTSTNVDILGFARTILNEIFKISLLTYLLFYVIENLYPGFISDYFNTNILLAITALSGTASALWSENLTGQRKLALWKDLGIVFLVTTLATGITFYNLQMSGWLRYVISGLVGATIVLISLFILFEEDEGLEES